uniref:Si:dkey-10o6.2 n=1 Tax=Echeneis naucrates TaxID=173247 RepID=A0A665X2D2_ECHNA
MSIPAVDFGGFSLSEGEISDRELHKLSRELQTAFTEVGFVFLHNTGITQEEVRPAHIQISCASAQHKMPHMCSFSPTTPTTLNPSAPDLKEAFNAASLQPDIKWPPSDAVPGFQEIQTNFFLRCKELSLRVLRVMAHSLGLDPEVFLSAHQFIGTDVNGTTLRSLYYPPVNSEKAKEGQLRCGEHSDYGSITLLFQNSKGLQVRRRSGEFITAPSIPGAVLVNIADLMQRWTSDQFVSVLHRVLLPPPGDSSTRQSLAFFVQPDDEAMISCCDGSNKYPPISAGDYLTDRFSESYGQS